MAERDDYARICSEKTLQWSQQGFFLGFADGAIDHAGGQHWLKKCFAKAAQDDHRLAAIWANAKLKEYLVNSFGGMQCFFRGKSAEIAQQKRTEAEIALAAKDYDKALLLVNQSVLRAPLKGQDMQFDSGASLALALRGRARVLLAMGKYRQALADLNTSLKEGLPEALRGDAYWKMAICHKGLMDPKKADISYSLARKLLAKRAIAEMDKEQHKSLPQEPEDAYSEPIAPKLSPGPNESMPSASSLVQVKSSPEMGRFAVAADLISTGAVLAVEEPYTAALLPECFGSHCHHCFKRLLAPIGCKRCAGVAFCSEKCRDAAEKYHKVECKILNLLLGSGASALCHAALRSVTQRTVEKACEIYQDSRISNLCSLADQRPAKDHFYRAMMALFLTRCLKVAEFFRSSAEEAEISLTLLKMLQQLQFNAHEIYETRRGPEHRFKGSKAAYVAVALYPTVAVFNHECYPAVARYFAGNKIVLRAIRPLQKGEIISENYGPIFSHKSLLDRQRSLKGRYWFDCHCLACLEDWPLLANLGNDGVRLKCSNQACKQLFSPLLKQELTSCPQCRQKTSLADCKQLLGRAEEQFLTGILQMDQQRPQEAVQTLCTALDTFHKVACPPHRDAHLAQESLRACFADEGNVEVVLKKL